MIKRVFWIIICVFVYVYILSSNKEDEVINTVKYLYGYCYSKIKQMDLQVEVNKWPVLEKKDKQQKKENKPRRRMY